MFDKNNAINLGHHVYKIRLKSSDLRKGKSGGFRLIILLVEIDNLITPVALYFKGSQANISKKEITYHIDVITEEMKKYAGAK